MGWRVFWGRQACAILYLAASSYAQTFDAQLTGQVRDASGAVVPAVSIVASNTATGVNYTAVSNGEGIYRFPALLPASYKVRAALGGFRPVEQGPITLQVNQVQELNFTLEPGNASDQVTVTSDPAQLETESATFGQVVTTRSIENLPLNVRDPMALVGLTPGVTFGPNFGNAGSSDVGRNFFKSDFNVGGGRSGSQEILLDGAPDTTGDVSRAIIDPPVDAVQEFKVQANSYDAQFGRTSGGVVNIVTRSGSNQIHGAAYDFERHSVLDAANFFNNRNGVTTPSFQRHQFGGVAGAPIRRDKWFVFGDYEGLRQGYPSTSLTTVPTALQLAGNFTQTRAANGTVITIYDPDTLTTLASGTKQRTAFPGNIIPQSRFDPVAAKLLSVFLAPNIPGNGNTGTDNYVYSANQTTDSNKYDVRSDGVLSEKTRVFGRVSRQHDNRLTPGTQPPAVAGTVTLDTYSQAVLDVVHVLSPTLVFNAQTSFSRGLAIQAGGVAPVNLSSFGFPSSFTNQVAPQLPVLSFSDISTITRKSAVGQQNQPRNSWVTRGSLNYLRGKHSLKIGAEWRVLDFNEYQNANSSGTFTFSRLFTQGPNPSQSAPRPDMEWLRSCSAMHRQERFAKSPPSPPGGSTTPPICRTIGKPQAN